MKKQMVVCFVAAAVMMLVTGCGTKEDRTTLHIKDGGKVVENITEDFNQDNYDEKELKTFIEQQIEDYKKESGNSVKSGPSNLTIPRPIRILMTRPYIREAL